MARARGWIPDQRHFEPCDDDEVVVERVDNKTYIRIPGGEIQVGHTSGRVVAWIGQQCIELRGPST